MPATHRPSVPAYPPKSAPRLFVTGRLIASQSITLDGPQAHYLLRVMRIAADNIVILCDNITGEWAARVTHTTKRDLVLIIETLLRPREDVPDFTLCAALLKKDRFDMLLEKATELGVRTIQPIITHRCVADKLNLDRAMAQITEAAEQCARTALPIINAPIKLDALLRSWPTSRVLYFADETGGSPAATAFADPAFAGQKGPAALLTGPEGGFDEGERAAIRALPQTTAITLGPRILRGETAAISATAIWMGVAGDW